MKNKRKISLIIALTVAALFMAETAYAGYTTPEIYGQNIRGSFRINNGATHTTSRDVTLNSSIIPSWRYYQYYFQSWYYNFAVNTSGFVPPYEWSGYEYVGGYDSSECGTTIDHSWDAEESPYREVDVNGNYVTDATARLYLAKVEDGVVGDDIEAIPSGNSNEGNLFRYDESGDLYIFNLSTDELSIGTWQLRVELDDGTSKYVTITLKQK